MLALVLALAAPALLGRPRKGSLLTHPAEKRAYAREEIAAKAWRAVAKATLHDRKVMKLQERVDKRSEAREGKLVHGMAALVEQQHRAASVERDVSLADQRLHAKDVAARAAKEWHAARSLDHTAQELGQLQAEMKKESAQDQLLEEAEATERASVSSLTADLAAAERESTVLEREVAALTPLVRQTSAEAATLRSKLNATAPTPPLPPAPKLIATAASLPDLSAAKRELEQLTAHRFAAEAEERDAVATVRSLSAKLESLEGQAAALTTTMAKPI